MTVAMVAYFDPSERSDIPQTPETRYLKIIGAAPDFCTLADFVESNADAFDPSEFEALETVGGFICGGGGAAPEFVVVRIS